MNRKNRRKAKAMAKKPLARLGVPMHTSVGRLSDGKFYWFATEDYQLFERVIIQNDFEAIDAQEFHGPFNTREEAARAADIAIAGEHCELKHAGAWDPAWNKAQ